MTEFGAEAWRAQRRIPVTAPFLAAFSANRIMIANSPSAAATSCCAHSLSSVAPCWLSSLGAKVLARFFSWPNGELLFTGITFIGTSVFDGFQCLVDAHSSSGTCPHHQQPNTSLVNELPQPSVPAHAS
ncbi:hypothetical protein ACFL2H_02300 [Planctomycetota bacterium]